MREPEFYKNWEDDNHCLQATVMMVLNTIKGNFSWEEVNEMTQYEENIYSWVPSAVLALSGMISGTRWISAMDYIQFVERGEGYLHEIMSPDWLELQKIHASPEFNKERSAAGTLIENGLFAQKDISVVDIEELLKNNMLIILVDAGQLARENWSSGHFVLVYGQDVDNFYMHDPGLPPRKSQIIDKNNFVGAYRGELVVIPWV